MTSCELLRTTNFLFMKNHFHFQQHRLWSSPIIDQYLCQRNDIQFVPFNLSIKAFRCKTNKSRILGAELIYQGTLNICITYALWNLCAETIYSLRLHPLCINLFKSEEKKYRFITLQSQNLRKN